MLAGIALCAECLSPMKSAQITDRNDMVTNYAITMLRMPNVTHMAKPILDDYRQRGLPGP